MVCFLWSRRSWSSHLLGFDQIFFPRNLSHLENLFYFSSGYFFTSYHKKCTLEQYSTVSSVITTKRRWRRQLKRSEISRPVLYLSFLSVTDSVVSLKLRYRYNEGHTRSSQLFIRQCSTVSLFADWVFVMHLFNFYKLTEELFICIYQSTSANYSYRYSCSRIFPVMVDAPWHPLIFARCARSRSP